MGWIFAFYGLVLVLAVWQENQDSGNDQRID